MRKLVVFNQLSIDGYFVDNHGDMSWAKQDADDEFNRFSSDRASGGGVLLFGRVTYELMASYWPTREAKRALPIECRSPMRSFEQHTDRVEQTCRTLLAAGGSLGPRAVHAVEVHTLLGAS